MVVLQLVVKIFVFLQLVVHNFELILQRCTMALISLKLMSSFTTLKRNPATSTSAALSNAAAGRFILLTRFFTLTASEPLRSHSSVAAYNVLLHHVEEEQSL